MKIVGSWRWVVGRKSVVSSREEEDECVTCLDKRGEIVSEESELEYPVNNS
ncbi:hypothetical protein Clim_0942 [Chlorobium limicola DSM 245]|uniref:Uncharacterized protein n=1 Tax=Chlorobium limicola (strain DSM 245 / NBRC 103803 / 6330) TaxID=290315 RepID=B3EIS7_CHLL2|nr:hypothetical protein Clim_0942 [Chlorobium limicola DSM 245]